MEVTTPWNKVMVTVTVTVAVAIVDSAPSSSSAKIIEEEDKPVEIRVNKYPSLKWKTPWRLLASRTTRTQNTSQ